MNGCVQALSMANGVKYGLAASIWTRALSSTELSQQPNNSDLETLALGLLHGFKIYNICDGWRQV